MKTQLIIWFCSVFVCFGSDQSVEKESIDATLKASVYEIFELAAQQNIEELSKKYIHKDYGVYDVFRIGVSDLFKRHDDISFAFPSKESIGTHYPNFTSLEKEPIPTELVLHNAKIDCGEIVWDRKGLFVTDKIDYPKVSEIIEHQEEFEAIAHNDIDKSNSRFIEENSYRIVLTELDIVFYMTQIDENWYLTLFDRVTTDCSA